MTGLPAEKPRGVLAAAGSCKAGIRLSPEPWGKRAPPAAWRCAQAPDAERPPVCGPWSRRPRQLSQGLSEPLRGLSNSLGITKRSDA